MNTHWFSVLSVAGIVLLTSNVFGNELRWGKPAKAVPVASSAMHIPTVISVNDTFKPVEISQVQHFEPVQPPRVTPVPDYGRDYDRDYGHHLDTRPVDRSVPPGARQQNVPPALPNSTPSPERRGMATSCGNLISLKSIREISHDIRPTHSGLLPDECIIDDPVHYGRHFSQTCFMWKASALSTRAAYFEDVQLERYGHTIVCPALQPVVSGAKFFATIPFLPYKMGVTPPNECVYTLGHHRPGNCAPYMVQPCPVSLRGALFQAGAVTGAVFAIP